MTTYPAERCGYPECADPEGDSLVHSRHTKQYEKTELSGAKYCEKPDCHAFILALIAAAMVQP